MSHWFTPAQELLMRGELPLQSADLRALLVMTGTSAAADRDAATLIAIETLDECNGAGYTRQTLSGATVTRDDDSDLAVFDADDLAWSAGLGAGTRPNAGVVIYRQGTDETDSLPVAYVDGGPFPFTATGDPVTIAWNAAGVLQLGGEGGVAEGPIYDGDKTITGSLTVENNLILPTGSALDYRDGWADVKAFGAVGDGVADDTAAIQAAIDSWPTGGPVYFPKGHYRITSLLVLRVGTQLHGSGKGYLGEPQYGTYIDAQASGLGAIWMPSNTRNVAIRNLQLRGYITDGGLGMGITSHAASYLQIDNVLVHGFAQGIYLQSCAHVTITDSHISGAGQLGLLLHQCSLVQVLSTVFANSGGALLASGANVRLTGATYAVIFDTPLQDETDSNGFWFDDCQGIIFRCATMFHARAGYTIRIGSAADGITIHDTSLGPFAPDRVPLNTIRIEAGAQHVRLINVTTDPNGGGDIDDQGTDTLYINVNGRTRHPVVATASLPAAGVAENGRILIEDAGAGNRNLVLYAGAERFRIDGGAAF